MAPPDFWGTCLVSAIGLSVESFLKLEESFFDEIDSSFEELDPSLVLRRTLPLRYYTEVVTEW